MKRIKSNRKKLTREQKKILKHKKGVAMVSAGPGSGKTMMLILFIIECIKRGIPPNKILVLTFSKATVSDFISRLEKEIGKEARQVIVLTFHAYGFKLIKKYFFKLGFTASPKKKNKSIKELVINITNKRNVSPKELERAFRCYDNILAGNENLKPEIKEALKLLLTEHRKSKVEGNIVDFYDMQRLPMRLFIDNRSILKEEAGEYECLLVDELQDINKYQVRLIKFLAKHIPLVLMVGDRKQSIYEFRGAHFKLWDDLEKALNPIFLYLTETFRCPEKSLKEINIVGRLICKDKPLVSNVSGSGISFKKFSDVDEQVDFIAEKIDTLTKKGVGLNEIVCLCQANKPLELMALALDERGITHLERTSGKKYASAVDRNYKLLRCAYKVARWLNSRGKCDMPKKAIKHILKCIFVGDEKLYKKILKKVASNGWESFTVESSHHCYRRVNEFKNLLIQASNCKNLEQAACCIVDAVKPIINSNMNNKKFKSQLYRDLSDVKLKVRNNTWANLKIKELKPAKRSKDGVLLTTCHQAKGKEWKYVFLTHVVEGSMPHGLCKTDADIDEGRRVFYVAITRHSKKLWVLQTPLSTQKFVNKNTNFNGKSRFIRELKQGQKK